MRSGGSGGRLNIVSRERLARMDCVPDPSIGTLHKIMYVSSQNHNFDKLAMRQTFVQLQAYATLPRNRRRNQSAITGITNAAAK